jgi:hypothetical protein
LSIEYSHHSHEFAGLPVEPLSRKVLALVFALILSVGAFVLSSREAQAKQAQADHQPTMVNPYTTTPDSGSTPLPAAAPVFAPHPVGVSALDTSSSQTSPSSSRMMASQPESTPAPLPVPEPLAQLPPKVSEPSQPDHSASPVDQQLPSPEVVAGKPAPPMAGVAGTGPPPPLKPEVKEPRAADDRQASALGRFVDPKLAPEASEPAAKPALERTDTFAAQGEDESLLLPPSETKLSASPEEKPFAESEAWTTQQLPQAPPMRGHPEVIAGGAGDAAVDQAPSRSLSTAPSATTRSAQEGVVGVTSQLLANKLANFRTTGGSTAQTLSTTTSAAATGATGLAALTDSSSDSSSISPEPSSAGSQVPSESDPQQPSSPSVPLDNPSFGLSAGAQSISDGTGTPLLLLGVLAWSVFLCRPERFLSLICWQLPKPSSASLVPLERPG